MKYLIPLLLAALPALSYTIPCEGSLPLDLQNLERQGDLVDSVPAPLAMQWVPFMPELTPEYIEAARTAWLDYSSSDPRLLEERVRQTVQGSPQGAIALAGPPIFETGGAIVVPGAVIIPEPALGLIVGAALLFLAGIRRR